MTTWRDKLIRPAAVVDHIKYHCGEPPDRKPRVTLLVGAGCSVTAGIPTAADIVRDYLKPHPLLKTPKPCKDGLSEYAHLMGELPPDYRMQIIEQCIEKAHNAGVPPRTKINWAHLLIATLVHHGYVKQILTTNFDPLLIDAMAITDQPVRTFDLTASDCYMPGRAGRGSIMYLHGQAHGLLQSHTSHDMQNIRARVRAVLQEALTENIMIVIGYSGECDPVFVELKEQFPQFRNRLYWVHYSPDSPEPPDHLVRFIETPGQEALLVVDDDDGWMDADTALDRIAVEGLKLPLLPLVSNPLEHTRHALARLCGEPKTRPGQQLPMNNPVDEARKLIARAQQSKQSDGDKAPPKTRKQIEIPIPLSMRISLAAMTGNVAELQQLQAHVERSTDATLKTALGTAFMDVADRIVQSDDNPDAAIPWLKQAQKFGTDAPHWLETVWGNALSAQAKCKEGEEADRLFDQACEKYAAAVKIKPDMHEAFNNWGAALSDHAKRKDGAEADYLFDQAFEKYAAAVKIKPDLHEAFYNWGNALAAQAKRKQGAEADPLFAQACEKYAAAVKIKPDKHEAFNSWGLILSDHAKRKDGAEADDLFAQACEKYAAAVKIKPDLHETFSNWGVALAAQAERKQGAEANPLFDQACEKYAAAVKIKPDLHEAFSNWGVALAAQAKQKQGAEVDRLFAQAFEKYAAALKIKPDDSPTMFNLACLEASRGRVEGAVEWLRKWRDNDASACRRKVDQDTDFDRVRNEPTFQSFMESLPA